MNATKKQLAFCEQVSPKGVGCGPGVDPARAESLVGYIHSRTSGVYADCAVLWMGDHIALVYFVSRGSNSGFRSRYYPAHVNLVPIKTVAEFERRGRSIHNCSMDESELMKQQVESGVLWGRGRLTSEIIKSYIEKAKAEDTLEPERLAAKLAAKAAARKAEAEREAKAAADRNEKARKLAETRSLAIELRDDAQSLKTHPDVLADMAAKLGELVIELFP